MPMANLFAFRDGKAVNERRVTNGAKLSAALSCAAAGKRPEKKS